MTWQPQWIIDDDEYIIDYDDDEYITDYDDGEHIIDYDDDDCDKLQPGGTKWGSRCGKGVPGRYWMLIDDVIFVSWRYWMLIICHILDFLMRAAVFETYSNKQEYDTIQDCWLSMSLLSHLHISLVSPNHYTQVPKVSSCPTWSPIILIMKLSTMVTTHNRY